VSATVTITAEMTTKKAPQSSASPHQRLGSASFRCVFTFIVPSIQ
jgi:hypothetical protein